MAVVSVSSIAEFFSGETRRISRGENALASGRLKKFVYDGSARVLVGKVGASMKKNVAYDVSLTIDDKKIGSGQCTCPRGRSRCHHMAVVLLHALKTVSSTDTECAWIQKKSKDEVMTVSEIFPPSKPDYCAVDRPVDDADRRWFAEHLQSIGNRPLTWILAEEASVEETTVRVATFDDIVVSCRGASFVAQLCEKLAVSLQERRQVELNTRGQVENPLWAQYRKGRVTASNFGAVLRTIKGGRKPSQSLMKKLVGGGDLSGVRAVQWGTTHEGVAVDLYALHRDVVVQSTGVWLHPSGLIGASPDGLVDEELLIEVKCPYSARSTPLADMADSSKSFYLKRAAPDSSDFLLNVADETGFNYFHQIQGNLHLTNRSACDLVVWTPSETAIIRIAKDPGWSENIPLLCQFCKVHFLPAFAS